MSCLSRILAVTAIILLTLLTDLTAATHGTAHTPTRPQLNYTTVPGFFLQDDPATNASIFDFQATNFGLINRTYPFFSGPLKPSPLSTPTQWQLFAAYLAELNIRAALQKTSYKVLFLGRHGEGYHNAAEAYYGTPAWNCYYSIRDGNATVSWSDARLTAVGVAQALGVHDFWARQFVQQKQPAPQAFYTSPLTRCLQTANYTWQGLDLPSYSAGSYGHLGGDGGRGGKGSDGTVFAPTIKELLREGISGHTCDRRSSRSEIHAAFPAYVFEDGFVETDPLWQALHGELSVDQAARSRIALDDIFAREQHATYISVTSHSGEIASILSGESLQHSFFSSLNHPPSSALPPLKASFPRVENQKTETE